MKSSTGKDFNYFNIKPILSRNAMMTFIIGSRGVGKTYSAKDYVLEKFQKNGKKYGFLKRHETEIEATVDKFWDDFQTEKQVFRHYKGGHQIGTKTTSTNDEGDQVEEIVWKPFGYSVALSTVAKLKGSSPQDVETLLWDEFVSYDGRYLRDEAVRLLDVMESFGRMNEKTRLIALGNKNENGYYPIFHELGLSKTSDFEDGKIYSFKGGQILILSISNQEYTKAKAQTKLGRIAKGTSYFEKMIMNTNESNYSELVGEKPRRSTPIFTIVITAEFYLVSFIMLGKNRALYIEQIPKPVSERKTYGTDNSIPTYPRLASNGINTVYGYLTSGGIRFDTQVTAQKTIQAFITKKR